MNLLLDAAQAAPPTKSVFISYSRADLGPVRALAMALRRAGLRTWMDLEDLRPGQRWKDAIGSALAAADAMVFCLSALSLESAWTSVELGQARARCLPVLPVAIERLDLQRLPEALRDLHVHDMSLHPPRDAARLTAHGIAGALGLPAAAPGAPARDAPAVCETVLFLMDQPPPAAALALALGSPQAPAWVDFRASGSLRLGDVLHWAGQARTAALLVGPATDPALAGLVLGTLCQAFGHRRVLLLGHGPVPAAIDAAGRVAGVLRVQA